jgi:hypothetical protein
MEEEGWKAKEIENMLEENDEDLNYVNKHTHFYPHGFTMLRKPFKYMHLNTVLRCLKKYSDLDLELSFVRKRKKEVPEDDEEVGGDENEVENDGEVESDDLYDEVSDDVPEAEDDEVEGDENEVKSDESSSEDEVCKSVKRMKFNRSPGDTESDTDNEKFERMRKKSNVCPKCKKNFSNSSNLSRHYTKCLTKTD